MAHLVPAGPTRTYTAEFGHEQPFRLGSYVVRAWTDPGPGRRRAFVEVEQRGPASCRLDLFYPNTADLRRGVQCEVDGRKFVVRRNGPKLRRSARRTSVIGPSGEMLVVIRRGRADAIVRPNGEVIWESWPITGIAPDLAPDEVAVVAMLLATGVPERMALVNNLSP